MTTNSGALSGWFKKRADKNTDKRKTVTEQAGSHSSTRGDSDSEPVVVWEATNRMEAEIVKGRLESEGIPAIIRGEALGTIYGLTTGGLAASDVLVPAPLADKATEILNTEVVWDESEDGNARNP